ncbi:MAG: ABC transporter permease [Chloroflexota bacterium]
MTAIRLLKERPWGIVGAVILLVVILLAILAPLITPYFYNEISIDNRLVPPGHGFLMGTDNLGRDIFSRLVYGTRPYVAVALMAVGTATLLGFLLGILSACARGKTDAFLRRAVFVPAILLAVVFLLLITVRTSSLPLLMINVNYDARLFIIFSGLLLSSVFLPSVYVITREAISPAFGRRIMPLLPLTLVNVGLAIGVAVLFIALLSFYGLGVPPPTPEWGNMIGGAGRRYLITAPWTVLWPSLAIIITGLGSLLFAVALREIWVVRPPRPFDASEQK